MSGQKRGHPVAVALIGIEIAIGIEIEPCRGTPISIAIAISIWIA